MKELHGDRIDAPRVVSLHRDVKTSLMPGSWNCCHLPGPCPFSPWEKIHYPKKTSCNHRFKDQFLENIKRRLFSHRFQFRWCKLMISKSFPNIFTEYCHQFGVYEAWIMLQWNQDFNISLCTLLRGKLFQQSFSPVTSYFTPQSHLNKEPPVSSWPFSVKVEKHIPPVAVLIASINPIMNSY